MQRRAFLKTTAAAGALAPLLGARSFAQPNVDRETRIKAIHDRIKPITKAEQLERIEKARRLMAEQGLDALLFEGGKSLKYFTGVNWGTSERLFAMVLLKNGNPQYIAPKFEEGRAIEQVGEAKLYTWMEHENPHQLVRRILQEGNALGGILGAEETVRQLVLENIGLAIPALNIVGCTAVTAGCRSVKSAHEIELMQIANDITAEVFKEAVATLREGMTERELGKTITSLYSDYGTSGGALVLFGEASAFPHGTVAEHVLREGQIVLIDGGCSVEGYSSDVTRTTVFGKPSAKMKDVWSIVHEAQATALAAARPGVSGESLDATARKVIADAGYGPDYKYFTHRLGHGIGMDGHEWYYLVRGNRRLLQAGNMFSDEPGVYIPGEFGIRLEDELLITESGAKLLLPPAESLQKIFSS